MPCWGLTAVAYDLSKEQLAKAARQATRPNLPQVPEDLDFIILNETYGYKGAIKEVGGRSCTVGHVL